MLADQSGIKLYITQKLSLKQLRLEGKYLFCLIDCAQVT